VSIMQACVSESLHNLENANLEAIASFGNAGRDCVHEKNTEGISEYK